jgi:uncharacterized membrane protein
MRAYSVDIIAVAFFIVEWLAYGFTLEQTTMAATACRRG